MGMRMSEKKTRRIVERHLFDGHRLRFQESGSVVVVRCIFCGSRLGGSLRYLLAASMVDAAEMISPGQVEFIEDVSDVAETVLSLR